MSANPLEQLRKERPDLFTAPPFWQSSLEDIARTAEQVTTLSTEIMGKSAGNRDIYRFASGTLEKQCSTATISSAMASDRPECFFDPKLRTHPSLVIIGSIHGGETEGIATCLELIKIMEHGHDWQGNDRSELREQLLKLRLNIIPCLNPDGRERAAISHLNNAEIDHIYLVQQGIRQDGSLFKGRKIKETQPIPPGFLSFMGGYYNDNGINLQHDDFFSNNLCPENLAILKLFRQELPDGFITFHAHGAKPSFTGSDRYLFPGYRQKQIEAIAYISARLIGSGIDTAMSIGQPDASFYFQTWLSQASGALPLLFELPHGTENYHYPLAQTLTTGLTVVETLSEFALKFGLRPYS